MAIALERDEVKRGDQTVRGISRDDVHFVVNQGAIDEAEIHHARLLREAQSITLAPAFVAVRPFEKFIAEAGLPAGNKGNDVRNDAQMKLAGVAAAHNHGKGILEAERF